MGYKLAEGKGLREGWDSKELWKSVEKLKALPFARRERLAPENSTAGDLVATRLMRGPRLFLAKHSSERCSETDMRRK